MTGNRARPELGKVAFLGQWRKGTAIDLIVSADDGESVSRD